MPEINRGRLNSLCLGITLLSAQPKITLVIPVSLVMPDAYSARSQLVAPNLFSWASSKAGLPPLQRRLLIILVLDTEQQLGKDLYEFSQNSSGLLNVGTLHFQDIKFLWYVPYLSWDLILPEMCLFNFFQCEGHISRQRRQNQNQNQKRNKLEVEQSSLSLLGMVSYHSPLLFGTTADCSYHCL